MGQDTGIPLTLDRVTIEPEISRKRNALQRISSLLARGVTVLTAEEIFDGLEERERLRSTGLGRGVALPHARLGKSASAVGALLSLPKGIEFDAPDGKPVSLIFGLLMPEDATAQHLRLLALLASAFRDPQLSEGLRGAETPTFLFELFRRETGG